MAEVIDLKAILDAYGVGVRAGAITPQTADEDEMRKLIGLPVMSDAVRADWAASGGIRRPVTLLEDDEPTPAEGESDE